MFRANAIQFISLYPYQRMPNRDYAAIISCMSFDYDEYQTHQLSHGEKCTRSQA